MTRARIVSRVLKPAIWLAALVPAARLAWGAFVTGDLGADPVRTIQDTTGLTTLILLFCTLAVTPLRRLTRLNELVRVRRLVGLFAFFYAMLHATSYFVFDQELSPPDIAADVAKHPWVLVGFTAWLLLIPLAVTSTNGWIRRLGKRWATLHRLVYPIAALGVLHFLWLVKKDQSEPLAYGAVLVALFVVRVAVSRMRASRRPAGGRPLPGRALKGPASGRTGRPGVLAPEDTGTSVP
ncbi:MAG TPA: protein-methionine-sulfoxide reductase heme-binding subunit MsrQ [Gemmatimonadales bacterium]|nr:protein-methionine-sulfoxide reductase heme-binding subunit MsrQ [Gemmatimonadales bacterium]